MTIKNNSKKLLLSQQKQMNNYFRKYKNLTEAGKTTEAAEYFQKTLETAGIILQGGQELLEGILDNIEQRVNDVNPEIAFKKIETEGEAWRPIDKQEIN